MIQTGDILLVSSNGLLPRLIQKFQKNKWNHAGLILSISGYSFVCEADKRGISMTPLTDYKKNINKKLLILTPIKPLSEEEKKKMIYESLKHCGHTPYEYINLLLYQPIKFITGKWIGGKTDKRFICGEWVGYSYFKLREYFKDWSKIAPVDLFNSEYFEDITIK